MQVLPFLKGGNFISGQKLSLIDKKFLLKLSRDTLESVLNGQSIPVVKEEEVPENVMRKQGCFVTLHKNGQLRGCIGHIVSYGPLYKCVMQNSVNSALNDSRFPPVTKDELSSIEIEISVLTPPEKIEYSTLDELLAKLTPFTDGVIIKNDIYQSTFLPQVWEQIPDKVDFLSQLCLKGGMKDDAWKDLDTEISVYKAIVFSEGNNS